MSTAPRYFGSASNLSSYSKRGSRRANIRATEARGEIISVLIKGFLIAVNQSNTVQLGDSNDLARDMRWLIKQGYAKIVSSRTSPTHKRQFLAKDEER
jgi:hypothetical protein